MLQSVPVAHVPHFLGRGCVLRRMGLVDLDSTVSVEIWSFKECGFHLIVFFKKHVDSQRDLIIFTRDLGTAFVTVSRFP